MLQQHLGAASCKQLQSPCEPAHKQQFIVVRQLIVFDILSVGAFFSLAAKNQYIIYILVKRLTFLLGFIAVAPLKELHMQRATYMQPDTQNKSQQQWPCLWLL
jgi:hypothetical protein